MERTYKSHTIYSKCLNSFGDQILTITNKNHDVIHQETFQEGCWADMAYAKMVINNHIKGSKK